MSLAGATPAIGSLSSAAIHTRPEYPTITPTASAAANITLFIAPPAEIRYTFGDRSSMDRMLAGLFAIHAALAPMPQPEVTVRLSVDASPGGVVATLTFTNASSSTVLIESFNAIAAPPLDADLFHIMSGGETVRYKGMMVKRGRPGASDYVRLEPGKPRTTAVGRESW